MDTVFSVGGNMPHADLARRAIELDDLRIQALLAADAQALRRLVHPKLIYTHSGGRQDDFDGYIADVQTRKTVYLSITRSQLGALPFEAGCLLEGMVDAQVEVQGAARTLHNRFMAFWSFEEGLDGRLLGWASTRIVAA